MATSTPFARLEQRLNRVALARTANALATFDGVAQPVPCQFDNSYALGSIGPFAGMGIASAQPRLTCATAQVPANPVGQAVTVAGGSYVVAEHQSDGTGVSVLLLEATA